MASHRVSAEITITGRRVLRHYVEHCGRTVLTQAEVGRRLGMTRRSVCHHVEWLVEGGYLESIPGHDRGYRATAVGREEIRQPSRPKSATGRARRACFCPQCRTRIPID